VLGTASDVSNERTSEVGVTPQTLNLSCYEISLKFIGYFYVSYECETTERFERLSYIRLTVKKHTCFWQWKENVSVFLSSTV
jgi:hypothetical protein